MRYSHCWALAEVQRAFIDDENQMFSVSGGKKEECQWRARWRHGNETGSPLLGPTRGWVLVPLEELDRLSGIDLGRALDDAGDNFAELKPEMVESVLCESPEALERESALLFRKASRKNRKGSWPQRGWKDPQNILFETLPLSLSYCRRRTESASAVCALRRLQSLMACRT